MPAAHDKTSADKPAPAPPVAEAKDQPLDPLKQIQQLVEKKIRNLEKRKVSSLRVTGVSPSCPSSQGKLDLLRKELADGKSLNDDQKKAVSKFEDVMDNLEFFRDFSKSVQKLADEVGCWFE